MPYDPSLDQEVFKELAEFDGTRIVVAVYSYNNGPKKLQIVRENASAEGQWRFAKVGRMSQDEAQALMPVLQKAIEQMN